MGVSHAVMQSALASFFRVPDPQTQTTTDLGNYQQMLALAAGTYRHLFSQQA